MEHTGGTDPLPTEDGVNEDRVDRRRFIAQGAGTLAAVAIMPEALAGVTRLKREISVGVIGCGTQGRAIIDELNTIEGVRISCVADVDGPRLRSGLRRVRGAEGFDSHQALLDSAKAQAVFIATGTPDHRPVVEDALAAGVDVYCEAPLAPTVDDALAIAEAARNSGRVFQAGFQGRANPVYQLARTFFRSDSVRDLISLRAQHHKKTSWRASAASEQRRRLLDWRLNPERSAGLSGEWGSHQFDVFHWYTSRYPVRVRGLGSVRFWDDGRTVPDTVSLQMEFDDGAVLDYQATLCNSYGGKYEVLHGSNAAIKLAWSHGWMFKEADAPTQGWEVYANRQQFHNDEGITLIAGATQLAEQGKLKEGVGLPHSSLYYAVEAFLKSITEGAEVVCDASEGARATIVGIRANDAVRTGRLIEISPSVLRDA